MPDASPFMRQLQTLAVRTYGEVDQHPAIHLVGFFDNAEQEQVLFVIDTVDTLADFILVLTNLGVQLFGETLRGQFDTHIVTRLARLCDALGTCMFDRPPDVLS